MPATLERIYLGASPTPCDSCGHDIKWNYCVRLENGAYMTVGSECVKAVCGLEPKNERLGKRAKAAERQWKNQKPVAQDGETREAYINRRLREMAQARAGWDEYRRVTRGVLFHLFAESQLRQRAQRKPFSFWHEERGGYGCTPGARWSCPRCQQLDRDLLAWQAAVKQEQEMILAGIEQRTNSNRFDWFGSAAYRLP
jgi:hypothetical protein